MSVLRKYSALLFIVGLLLVLVRSQPRPSSDFGWYIEWAKVLSTGDFFQLATNTLSPQLLPLNEHFPGVGYLFVVPKLLLHTHVTFESSAYLTGFFSTVVFWICAFSLLFDFSNNSMPLALFGFGALFIGTHAGYQATAYASENLAVTMLAVMMASLDLKSRAPSGLTLLRILAFSSAGALLIAIKPNLGIYVAAGGIVVLIKVLPARLAAATKLVRLAAAALPLAGGLVWLLLHNFWLTGDWRRSPYQFGDGQFRSIDLRHPEFAAVLFHPFHGLLLFHPLYGVALLVLALAWMRQRLRSEKVFYAVATLGLLLNAVLQASWYGWWMGTDTFGGRAFSTYSIVLMPILVGFLADLEHRRTRTAWVAAVCACVLWSFPILVHGPFAGATYAEFFAGYGRMLSSAFLDQPENMVLIPAAYVLGRIVFSKRESAGSDAALPGIVCAIWSMIMIVLFEHSAAQPAMRVLKVAAVAVLPLFVAQAVEQRDGVARCLRISLSAIFAVTLAIFACAVLLVGRLYATTETARNNPRVRACYEYQSDFYYPEVALTSLEYQELIPGFEAGKANMARFVREQGEKISRVTPADSTADCLHRAGHVYTREYWLGTLIWRTILRH